MDEIFSAEFFIGNRQRLRQLFTGLAPIVITANGVVQRNGDNTFKFRQDSSFWYLTGIEHPDITLVLDKNKEYLLVPSRDFSREMFDGAVTAEVLTRRSGVGTVLDDTEGWKQLGARLKRSKHVATLGSGPAYIERNGFYTNPARAELIKKLKEQNDELEILDLREHLMKMRLVKQPQELEAIQKAIDVTIDGLKYVTAGNRLAKYASENEIEADLFRQYKRAGYGYAFDPIVASGVRSCQMHYIANNGPLSSDELIIFDVSTEVEHYASDIARTYALGEPSKRQQAVYDAVCEVQDFALTMLRPGTVNIDYEKAVEEFMGEKLRELGLIKTIEHETVRRFFPHATTHFLGLDAHDVGDYQQPMEPGMVMVCEPGIYIPVEGIGVRIEDDFLITPDGHTNLSARLPRVLK